MKQIIVFIALICQLSLFSTPYHGEVGFEGLYLDDVIIGIYPNERIIPQPLVIDMQATIDPEQQDANLTFQLANLAKQEAQEGQYLFIDVLGLTILKKSLDTHPEIDKAFIRIQKPHALPKAKSGGMVEIGLSREGSHQRILGKIGFKELKVEDSYIDVFATIDLVPIFDVNELDATVDYAFMAQMLEQKIANRTDQTYEDLSIEFLQCLLNQYPCVEEASIRIRKPDSIIEFTTWR